tara:strand:+ start:24666 stop:24884 length:219 start_codon:yes stop_codon:yes gene_type:complete
MGPKEDRDAKKDRLREQRLSLIDRRKSAEETAGGLTTDLRSVYGLGGLSLIGQRGTKKATATVATPKAVTDR